LGVKLLAGATVAAAMVPIVANIVGRSPEVDTFGKETFSKGTINLSIKPNSVIVAFESMLPGDRVTQPFVITSEGSEPVRYSLSSSATNDDGKGLRDQLTFIVKTSDISSSRSPCDDFDGTQLYAGDLDAVAGRIIGDPSPGQDGAPERGGDRVMLPGSSETLCFRVSLPLQTGNAFQDATTMATFTFDAEQVASG
jgi:hypothetical protein